MKTVEELLLALKQYKGKPVNLMEVCGTHTGAIRKSGIRDHLPPSIRLVSGPGCPVCVTPGSLIDESARLSREKNVELVTFGDMMKVPGVKTNLYEARALGGRIRVIYSPLSLIETALKNPNTLYVLVAVGFETTAPIYGLLMEQALLKGISNLRLLMSVKTILPAMALILQKGGVDGFICPGHVTAVTGTGIYQPLAQKYGCPFVVAGFETGQILAAIYELVHLLEENRGEVRNFYPAVVRQEGNEKARELMNRYFEPYDAVWRGIGVIPGSGLRLKKEYRAFDALEEGFREDREPLPKGCCCTQVITGELLPDKCPCFGKSCTPDNPLGPCMVSSEGACGVWYLTGV